MRKNRNDVENVRKLTRLLSDENKRCVIAAAEALLFAQEQNGNKQECKTTIGKMG